MVEVYVLLLHWRQAKLLVLAPYETNGSNVQSKKVIYGWFIKLHIGGIFLGVGSFYETFIAEWTYASCLQY